MVRWWSGLDHRTWFPHVRNSLTVTENKCESWPNLNVSYEIYDSQYNQMSVFSLYIQQMQALCTMS